MTSDRVKQYRQRLKAEGRCFNHPSEFLPCVKCKRWREGVKKRLIANGLCGCGKPSRPNRRTCAECGKKNVEKNRQKGLAELAAGRCRLACGRAVLSPHTLCDYHLEKLRVRAKVLTAERIRAGLCRQCGRRSELGQVFCLIHRKRQDGLPQPVRSGLTKLKKAEKKREANNAARAAREFIERHIHLINHERTRTILRMRYGYTSTESATLEEVGAKLNVTRERVRQIQQLAEDRILMFTIEKEIPIPSRGRGQTAEIRDTLKAMNVGDSFVIPESDKGRNDVRAIAKTMGLLITTRKVPEGRRVWLVSKSSEPKQIHAAA